MTSRHAQGQPLRWPRLTGYPKALHAALEELGATELARRWQIMLADPFSRPSLMGLVTEPDKWTTPRTAGGNARPFHNPAPVDDFKPAQVLGQKGNP